MPHPSSTAVEEGWRMEDDQKGLELVGLEIHSAKRGVIFQRTGLETTLVLVIVIHE